MAKDFLGVSILDVMPDSIRGDPQIQAAAKSLDAELSATAADIRENLLISRIDELPEAVLDLLAWQWHVDFYEPLDMDIAVKRKLIRESIAWHRIKGTPAAVERLTQAVFRGSLVNEWYEYGGQPYHFRVINVTAERFDENTVSQVLKAINATKNVRSWLDEIWFLRAVNTDIYYGVVPAIHKRYVTGPRKPHDTSLDVAAYWASMPGQHKKHVTGARKPCDTDSNMRVYVTNIARQHKRVVVGKGVW